MSLCKQRTLEDCIYRVLKQSPRNSILTAKVSDSHLSSYRGECILFSLGLSNFSIQIGKVNDITLIKLYLGLHVSSDPPSNFYQLYKK